MAYTFDELATWWSGKSYPVGHVTLVFTQEDGRTCYADGFINSYNAATKEFLGQFSQQFNDRTRQLTYGPPAVSAGAYVQNFDRNAGVDLANFVFVKKGANAYELRLTLLRWGNALVTIKLAKATQAKLHTGWGATIGHGSGAALYALALTGAEETPG